MHKLKKRLCSVPSCLKFETVAQSISSLPSSQCSTPSHVCFRATQNFALLHINTSVKQKEGSKSLGTAVEENKYKSFCHNSTSNTPLQFVYVIIQVAVL